MKGFEFKGKTRIGTRSVIYYGVRLSDQFPVNLKTSPWHTSNSRDLNRRIRDFEVGKCFDNDCILQYQSFDRGEEGYVTLLEHFDAQNLKDYLETTSVDIESALDICLQLVRALDAIHDQEFFHGGICLDNVLIEPSTRQIKLADFSDAISFERASSYRPGVETNDCFLPYLSPEQSGRLGQVVDFRSDFYSLGVCIYYLLTNRFPFEENDPSAYFHAHIAKIPPSPDRFSNNIPGVLSDLVLKLLSKQAADRYQSVKGILDDISNCRLNWARQGSIPEFTLGEADIVRHFTFLNRFFGREEEIRCIKSFFEADPSESNRLMLVTGEKGVGKTALLEEIHRSGFTGINWVVEGAFESGPMPYTGYRKAIGHVINAILGQSDAELQLWKKRFIQSLDSDLHYIVNLLPELQKVTGPLPGIADFSQSGDASRFNRALAKFLMTLTQNSHRMLLLLDDLQHADEASLNLLEAIAADPSIKGLAIIAFYRSGDSEPKEHSERLAERWSFIWPEFKELRLMPLNETEVKQLILKETGGLQEIPQIVPEVLIEKTGGQPFSLRKLLKEEFQNGAIILEKSKQGKTEWRFDLEALRARPVSSELLVEMIVKLDQLDKFTRKLLEAAACVGIRFDLEMINLLTGTAEEDVILGLNSAKSIGLIRGDDSLENEEKKTGALSFRFTDEALRQQVYERTDKNHRDDYHYRLARFHLERLELDPSSGDLFVAVNHLNEGKKQIGSRKEELELVRLNLKAGSTAMQSKAYQVAISFFEEGISILSEKGWRENYQECLSLHQNLAEALYLSSDFSRIDKVIRTTLQYCQSLEDRARISAVEIESLIAQNRSSEALTVGITNLRKLGFNVPKNPGELYLLMELLSAKYRLNSSKAKVVGRLPRLTDRRKRMIAKLTRVLLMAAYIERPKLFVALILKFTRFTLKHGLSDELNIFSLFGYVLTVIIKDQKAGYFFGEIANRLLEDFPECKNKASVVYIHNLVIKPWRDSFDDCATGIHQAHRLALEVGQKEVAANSLATYDALQILSGAYLPDIEKEMADHCKFLRLYGHQTPLMILTFHREFVLNLLNRTEDPCRFPIEPFQKSVTDAPGSLEKGTNTLPFYYAEKIFLSFLFDRYEEAVEGWFAFRDELKDYPATFAHVIVIFIGALSLLKVVQNQEVRVRRKSFRRISLVLKQLKYCAKAAPQNYSSMAYLLEAEMVKVKGEQDPLPYYQTAIKTADQAGYKHIQGIANQMVADYWLQHGESKIAGLFLSEARTCFTHWGATAKVRHLEETYGVLFGSLQKAGSQMILREEERFDPDIHFVMEAIKTITGEVVPSKLVSKILQVIIQNSGAQKGYIVHKTQQEFVAESCSSSEEAQEIRESDYGEIGGERFCHSIINYVLRTGEDLVLDNASKTGAFLQDTYIKKGHVKSVLCIPFQYRERIFGVLYLENRLVEGLFSKERMAFIKPILAQAAISMENALLYEKSIVTQRELQKSEEKYRTLVENTGAMVLHITIDGTILFINSAGARFFHKNPVDLIGESLYSLSNSCAKTFKPKVLEICKSKERLVAEGLFVLPDQELWFYSSFYPVMDELNNVVAVQIMSQNISEHKQAVEELSRLSTILETTSDFVGIYAPDGSAQYINQAGKEMIGLDDEVNLINLGLEDFHPRSAMKIIRSQGIPSAIESGRWSGESILKNISGREIPVSQVIMSHKSRTGDLQFLSTILRDISRQKETEQELKEYKLKLEGLVEERTSELRYVKGQLADETHKAGMAEIAAGTLHNVGNLLNSIKTSASSIGSVIDHSSLTGFVRANELLRNNMDDLKGFFSEGAKGGTLIQYYLKLDQAFSEEQTKMKADLQRLNEKIDIVSDIIVAQQTYAGLDSHMEDYSLVTLVEDALILEAGLIDRYNITVIKQYDKVPLVRIQKTKMIHILINLIKNARDAMMVLPFEDRRLTFSISSNQNEVLLKVKDTGIGIKKEMVSLIFTHGFTTKEEGHGFGLNSSINFINEMGGEMWVESEGEGQGACFFLQFKKE